MNNDTVSSDVLCATVGSVLLMDEAKNDTVPLLSNGGPDVAISMDGVGSDKQRYQQQLQLIDEQVFLIIHTIIIRVAIIVSIIIISYN